jgi:hypothetical protein
MTRKLSWIWAATLLVAMGAVSASAASHDLKLLAEQAVSTDAQQADAAIRTLRDAGPEGLQALLAVHAAAIEQHRTSPPGNADSAWKRLSAALNAVGAQYDCHASKLYWYTDLEKAKAAAKTAGKPILSLRMLGKLTEECSCANSRFFRSTLYANEEISKVLRERFILYWKSVRPVPKVTIDFGDDRVMERTITGNSIHYILDVEGRPIEAIPGLYGPKAFMRQLGAGLQSFQVLAAVPPAQRERALMTLHSRRGEELVAAWRADLLKAGVSLLADQPAATYATSTSSAPAAGGARSTPPTAREAAAVAVTKMAVEIRLVDDLSRITVTREAARRDGTTLEKAMAEDAWTAIAALHKEDATLDASSIALIREHNPSALRAAAVAETKRRAEDPLLRMVATLQNSTALDTVRNEYLYHRRIHEWFAAGEPVTRDVEDLNRRVYAELFLTPDSDPWLGLMAPEVYTGLRDHGVVRAQ